jgi:hypothetical protein
MIRKSLKTIYLEVKTRRTKPFGFNMLYLLAPKPVTGNN